MVSKDGQRGSMLLELMLVLAVMLILAVQVLPQAFKFYRQAAVEYEAEKLLADIRYCRNANRLTAESAWNHGAQSSDKHNLFVRLYSGYNCIYAGEADVLRGRNYYLPGIRASKEKENGSLVEGQADIKFDDKEKPKALITVLIYYDGYPQEGREIMVSKGGRIRMERGKVGRR